MIVCSICGGTDVKCAAVIDPDTQEFIDVEYEAFLDGECSLCGNIALTDPDEVKTDMDKRWKEYMKLHHTVPNYARCDIARHGDCDGCESAFIRIGGPENAVEKHRIVAVCRDLEELKTLTVPDSDREFTVVECQLFEFHEVLEDKTYNIEVDDRTIFRYDERGAGLLSGRIRSERDGHRAICRRLHSPYQSVPGVYPVARSGSRPPASRWGIFDEALRERQLSQGFVSTGSPDERLYAPYKYAVYAHCLDNIQTFDRRYITFEQALLHF